MSSGPLVAAKARPGVATGMTVRRIGDLREFEGLASIWNGFIERGRPGSIFLSHDWLSCCWQFVQADRHPEVLLVEDGARPVGALPLLRWQERRRALPIRCVGFLTSPDSILTEPLAAVDVRTILDVLIDYLGCRDDWDVIQLEKLADHSPTLRYLERRFATASRRVSMLSSPYLHVTGEWETFWERFSTPRLRKTLRNIQNRLARAGTISVEQHRAVDPDGSLFRDMLHVSRRGWKSTEGLSMATMKGMPQFFAELTRRANRRGWLSLWLMRLNGHAIAMEYQLEDAGVVHALRADYDEAYGHLSPGTALSFAIVKSLFERHEVTEYDMGPGSNDYKIRWASDTRSTVHFEIYARHARARLLYLLETVAIPKARRLRDGLVGSRPFQ